jgi:hypothetical protein
MFDGLTECRSTFLIVYNFALVGAPDSFQVR